MQFYAIEVGAKKTLDDGLMACRVIDCPQSTRSQRQGARACQGRRGTGTRERGEGGCENCQEEREIITPPVCVERGVSKC